MKNFSSDVATTIEDLKRVVEALHPIEFEGDPGIKPFERLSQKESQPHFMARETNPNREKLGRRPTIISAKDFSSLQRSFEIRTEKVDETGRPNPT